MHYSAELSRRICGNPYWPERARSSTQKAEPTATGVTQQLNCLPAEQNLRRPMGQRPDHGYSIPSTGLLPLGPHIGPTRTPGPGAGPIAAAYDPATVAIACRSSKCFSV